MPQIIINEIDNTTPGGITSNSFAVAIPGLLGYTPTDKEIADAKANEILDDNNIYKISSDTEFETYIKKISTYKFSIAASSGIGIAPVLTSFWSAEHEGTSDPPIITPSSYTVYGYMTKEMFNTYIANGTLYTGTPDSSDTPAVGYLESKLIIDSTDYYYKWTKVGDSTEYSESTKYCIIEKGNEGADAPTDAIEVIQVGNQMAKILVNLGYTVYYIPITNISDIIKETIWEPFKDKSAYNIRYLVSGFISDSSKNYMNIINTYMAKVAATRGDIIALQDINKAEYANATNMAEIIEGIHVGTLEIGANKYSYPCANTFILSKGESYATLDADPAAATAAYSNTEFPMSLYYLDCFQKSIKQFPEYFAIANSIRGFGSLHILSTCKVLGDQAVQQLQKRTGSNVAVNLIIKDSGAFYIYGNRTGHINPEGLVASSFANIRQLCCTLKKHIYKTCRTLMFDPNSDILWNNFRNSISVVLDHMRDTQGISDYKFVKFNTKVKGKLFAGIRIIPIEAVEDFEITLYLDDDFNLEITEPTEEIVG